MEDKKVCVDCGKEILPTEVSQYFSGTKQWWHWEHYQEWSKRMMERAISDYGLRRERRTA